MKALRWHGTHDVTVDEVPDPTIQNPTDMVIQMIASGLCGSDLHMYDGFIDKYPVGAFFNKGLTMRAGQTHVHRYLVPLLDLILEGRVKPSEVVTHHIALEELPEYYRIFRDKENECLKAVVHF